VLIITSAGRMKTLESVHARLGERLAGLCTAAVSHVPLDVVQAAVRDVDRVHPDALVAIGGGSAIGLAKAVCLERSLPIVAVPTTYAGSEMTDIWGVTNAGVKQTGRDPRVAPKLVLYDPSLTTSLGPRTSAASGMNAMAHAVEAMYAVDASDATTSRAESAIRMLAQALPRIYATPSDLEARTLAMRGAHAAGHALQHASMGLHHKICHVLGGTFGLPHAPTHAAVLPRVVAFNGPAAPEAMNRIAAALGTSDAADGLHALNQTLGLTMSLSELGLRTEDIPRAAELVASSPYNNPRQAFAADVALLLQDPSITAPARAVRHRRETDFA
jgi:alcohol dehydrogenase class IV